MYSSESDHKPVWLASSLEDLRSRTYDEVEGSDESCPHSPTYEPDQSVEEASGNVLYECVGVGDDAILDYPKDSVREAVESQCQIYLEKRNRINPTQKSRANFVDIIFFSH